MSTSVWVVIPAAGSGSRMKSAIKKQFLPLKNGTPLLIQTLRLFEEEYQQGLSQQGSEFQIAGAALVVSEEDIPEVRTLLEQYHIQVVKSIVPGGATRQQSVFAGLLTAPESCELIAIHDAARPYLTAEDLHAVLRDARLYDASVLGVPSKDTMKLCDQNGFVVSTPDRNQLFSVQTPQVFDRELITHAHRIAADSGLSSFTDDAAVVENVSNTRVHICPGSYGNIKITTPEDL